MSSSPGVLPRDRDRIASIMLSTHIRLSVFRPSVTDLGNDAASARRLPSTPALSRSACSDGVCTALSRPSQKADTLEAMSSCEVCTVPSVICLDRVRCTLP